MKADPYSISPEVKKILKSLGLKIREYRKLMRIRTSTLLADTGLSRSTLTRIEKGSPAVAIAAYFQVMYFIGVLRDLKAFAGIKTRD